ncbi:MAG: SDR family NAD(P)-dependent oxidoreductase [Chloroflexi bacterium]|nr:SDR family NAD(P)-dependent oxidoreductase [Chloroflexota bacterium]
MANKLEGKVTVITGGGRGIGRDIALMFASEGAKVVVNDIYREPDGSSAADNVCKEIRQAGGAAVATYQNVATMDGGAGIIKGATDNFGRIDVLINNAGNYVKKPIPEMTEAIWDSIIGVHLKGHFACTMAALPHMMRQKSGRIINFSSRGAFTSRSSGSAGAGNLAYSVAKAGILSFTTKLADEMAPYNITVNCILPSATTQLFPGDLNKRSTSDGMPRSSQKAGPDFVAPMIAYLASDNAQKITGRYIYASAGDIVLYTHPLKLAQTNVFIRKQGKWTMDELDEVVPPLLGVG